MLSLLFSVTAGAAAPATTVDAETKPPKLDLVAQFELPEGRSGPVDVRWAGKDSIYIAWHRDGVSEHDLEEGLPFRREWLPDLETGGFLTPLENLAVSSDWLLASAPANRLTWREHRPSNGGFNMRSVFPRGHFHDIDLEGSRLVLVGLPSGDEYRKTAGGLVWIGELSATDVEDWRAVYESEYLAENFDRIFARYPNWGSVRFLGNGDIIAYPGPQLELLLLSSTGKIKDRWTAGDLWGDEAESLAIEELLWDDFEKDSQGLQKQRLGKGGFIDEVLAFGDDPAVIVRRPSKEGRRWLLGLLGPEIQWYEIPGVRLGGFGRLRGDVDEKGRLVLLGTGHGVSDDAYLDRSQVLVLELPLVPSDSQDQD